VTAALVRETFDTSRAAEFLERRALQAQTGQRAERFGDVIAKELLDNALDAAETAGVAPEIEVRVTAAGEISVGDNGCGMPASVVERILNFDVLVSDKAAYRSPTRGLQGNAFKTVLGIPYALGVTEPVVIEAQGVRHEVAVSIDPGGNVVVRHDRSASPRTTGTAVTVPLPVYTEVDAAGWVEKFAALNPHATLVVLDERAEADGPQIYKPTVGGSWSKPVPPTRRRRTGTTRPR
jgi:DNA topoisomerase VI subunit B